MADFMVHDDEEVRAAIIRLTDALAESERNTGRRSVLIVRQQGGFSYRAQDGRPVDENLAFSDDTMFRATLGEEYQP